MGRPLISVPIDIPDSLKDTFAGLALYNTGSIVVAYRRPILMRMIRKGNAIWTNAAMVIDPDTKLTLECDLESEYW